MIRQANKQKIERSETVGRNIVKWLTVSAFFGRGTYTGVLPNWDISLGKNIQKCAVQRLSCPVFYSGKWRREVI